MSINWEKYFDAIWCLDYKPNILRKQLITKEFERIGISNHSNFKFHETFPSPYDQYFYNCLLKDGKINKLFTTSPGNMNASFGHYSIIKKSILDNYNRILIIENDMSFLKDINLIEKILNSMPMDYDIILFDYFIHCSIDEFNNYKKINEYYYEYVNLASTGCYSLSQKAMNIFSKLYEEKIYPPDVYTSKYNLNGILKKAFTPHNLACQLTFSSAMNCVSGDELGIHNMYKKTGLNYNDYNINNIQNYKYGDLIKE